MKGLRGEGRRAGTEERESESEVEAVREGRTRSHGVYMLMRDECLRRFSPPPLDPLSTLSESVSCAVWLIVGYVEADGPSSRRGRVVPLNSTAGRL